MVSKFDVFTKRSSFIRSTEGAQTEINTWKVRTMSGFAGVGIAAETEQKEGYR